MYDVYKKGFKLSWKKPKHDGGQHIENYVIEKSDKALGDWVYAYKTDKPVTKIYINDLIPGRKYEFRVKAVNKLGKSRPLTADHTIKAPYPIGKLALLLCWIKLEHKWTITILFLDFYFYFSDTPSRPLNIEIKAYEIDSVELDWDEPRTDGGSIITSYIIEMRDKTRWNIL